MLLAQLGMLSPTANPLRRGSSVEEPCIPLGGHLDLSWLLVPSKFRVADTAGTQRYQELQ